eukprot:6197755-Pleurochrysis_carterae.AAC.3
MLLMQCAVRQVALRRRGAHRTLLGTSGRVRVSIAAQAPGLLRERRRGALPVTAPEPRGVERSG